MGAPGFDRDDLKPLTKKDARELREANRELEALRAWVLAGGNEERASQDLGIGQEKARLLIRRGMRRYYKDRMDDLDGLRARQLVEMEMMREPTLRKAVEGNSQAFNDILRLQERESKLLGLDAQKDKDDGPQVIVIESRMPWERQEPPIDGEAVDVPALPEPDEEDE